jgi:hypothetical protein
MSCTCCCNEIKGEIKSDIGFGNIYCEECFKKCFSNCVYCDLQISWENTCYNYKFEPCCKSCFNEYSAFPENPNITNEMRSVIIKLCQKSLKGGEYVQMC